MSNRIICSCSFPLWQDCHEMWCKKRRRNKEGKSQEDSSRPSSSNNKPRKDSTSTGTKPANVGGGETEQSLKVGNGASNEKIGLTGAGGLKDSLSKIYVQKKMHNNSLSEEVETFEKGAGRNVSIDAKPCSNDSATAQVIDGQDDVLQKLTDRDRRHSDSSHLDFKPYNAEFDGHMKDKNSDRHLSN